ncbi:MAG TPA: type II toxin-antitoxin system death-on-curing family toxin [Thermomicrobiales bacterium]|nr:type II toxin-antitoxin system death-on-curing family toxin [Thermomicrobiales bacterium]
MNGLTAQEVLFLHHRIIIETGGMDGVRDISLIEAALARPGAGFGGYDLFPDLFQKIASIVDALIQHHPFVDGNKRTGIAVGGLLLVKNGRRLTATNQELEDFAVSIAVEHPEVTDIAVWFKEHSTEA